MGQKLTRLCRHVESYFCGNFHTVYSIYAPINVTAQHGAMKGFALVGLTKPQGLGNDWHANPLHIPYLAPTGAQSKQRTLCYMSAFCMFIQNTNVSNTPLLEQQIAGKSPRNPILLGIVGHDNDRRIKCRDDATSKF